MKELSIEDKARRYDEALKKAVIAHKDEDKHLKATLERIFPALKESEDEIMRNAAINACKYMADNFENSTKQYEDAIIWLEKQGEQKPTTIQIGRNYKCISSPRYTCFQTGLVYKPCDEFICSLMNFCSDCFELIEDDEQKPAEWHSEDEQNLNACLGFIPDEFLRRWLKDAVHVKCDKPADNVEP